MDTSWVDRAHSRTKVNPITQCWEYCGEIVHNGYGRISHGGRNVRVHRLSYLSYKGEIIDGRMVCHTCDVRNCWNPDHLFLGTAKDNVDDMLSKGRAFFQKLPVVEKPPRKARQPRIPRKNEGMGSPKGERNHFAVLREPDVHKIRDLMSGGSMRAADVASVIGVSPDTVYRVIQGKTWKHVPYARQVLHDNSQ